MTPEQLFHAIGQAEDDLLESSENHRPQRWRPWRRWAAMAAAACLLLAIGLGVGISLPRPGDGLSNGLAGGGSSSSSAVEDPDQGTGQSGGLASLALDWDTSGGAGPGEAFWTDDPAQLIAGSPWTESDTLTTLPVYRHTATQAQEIPVRWRLTAREQAALARSLAVEWGADPAQVYEEDRMTYYGNGFSGSWEDYQALLDRLSAREPAQYPGQQDQYNYDANIQSVSLKLDGMSVKVDDSGERWNIALAQGPQVLQSPPADLTELQQSLEEMGQELADRLGYRQPAACWTIDYATDYAVEGEVGIQPVLRTGLYEGYGSLEQQIVSYSLNRADPYASGEQGEGFSIWVTSADLSNKLGDYPVISLDEARQQLEEDAYYCSTGDFFPGQDSIAAVEIAYRGREILAPYYRFIVEVDTSQLNPDSVAAMEQEGCKHYAAFYVAAVESEYLEPAQWWEFN